MTGFGVELRDLSVRFRTAVALDGVTATILPDTICGLLGRNGSGKTTLLSTIAAFRRPSGGSVRVDGEEPWENPRVLAGVALVREGGDLPDVRVGEVLRYGAAMRPTWSGEVAERLLERFDLRPSERVEHLSRGQRAALTAASWYRFGGFVGVVASPLTAIYPIVSASVWHERSAPLGLAEVGLLAGLVALVAVAHAGVVVGVAVRGRAASARHP